ncbi:Wall-associated receptor kinase 3 [Hordeum vulgare]|nr:Wall-associated receptor kinase 3 [Hordeum vulgare]
MATGAKCLLTRDDRIRVALEAADALACLHSFAVMPISHRDVKSTSILLDDTFTTKVLDFDAPRSIFIDQTHVVTIVQGTFGFDVILVELLTRNKPILPDSLGEQQNLCHCFLGRLRDEAAMDIMHAQVVEVASQSEIDKTALVPAMCLRTRGGHRPNKMKEVELRHAVRLQLLRARRRPTTPRTDEQELQRHGRTKSLLSTRVKSRSTSVAMAKNVELGVVVIICRGGLSRRATPWSKRWQLHRSFLVRWNYSLLKLVIVRKVITVRLESCIPEVNHLLESRFSFSPDENTGTTGIPFSLCSAAKSAN